jgi:tetratricopeptide (TPR) repeat protein
LSFFNGTIGGPRNGYRHLVDSSVDWGQDLRGLAEWLHEHNSPQSPTAQPIYLSYLGNGNPEFYGIQSRHLPSNSWWQTGDYPAFEPGIYCISATLLQQVYLLPVSRWTPQLESLYQMALPRIEQLQRHELNPPVGQQRLPDEIVRRIRFGRLCAFLREREPDDEVGHSILIYFLKAEDIDRALRGPPSPMANESADDLAAIAEELAVAGLTDIPEELYRKALRDLPDDAHCHKNLGLLLNRQGRHAEAAAEFETAVRLNPNSAEAHNNLAAMFVKLGRTDDAIRHYEEAIHLRRNWPEAHANLAGLYADNGDLESAIANYAEALRLYPNWPIMHTHLGNALAKFGRLDDAIREYEKALQLQPDLQKAKDGLRHALERKADTASNTPPPPSR